MREFPKITYIRTTKEQHQAVKDHGLAAYIRKCIDRFIVNQGKKK